MVQNDLAKKKCIPCEAGVPPMGPEEISRNIGLIDEWEIIDNKKLHKNFKFKDFRDAMVFVSDIAGIAEREGHHPDICISYNKVSIDLSTHVLKGLSENDFVLAAKIDGINR